MRSRSRSQARQVGMSMIEVLVAITILAVAFVIALSLYDAARKSFKKGENVSEQQQAVRIASDKLNADLRMAGYNYNPDGDIARPDEQIEGAFDTAVTIRADYDAEDPTASVTPETTLATGGAFSTVSTGNDEIVTYVLAKPDGSSPDTLTFYADLHSPRTGVVQQVDIPHVALTQDNPPYTLYRVTLSNTDGSPVKTPLVENIRSMTYTYYAQDGTQVASAGGSETATSKAARASIRRVTLDLVGLTREPDVGWTDTTDTHASTRAYRKFDLTSDVAPRNLGMKGVRDIMSDVVPPSKPGAPTLYTGHCGGLYVTWPANPSADAVVGYRVNFGTVSSSPTGLRSAAETSAYVGGLSAATMYYVTIQALDAAGNVSVNSDERSATTTNTTTPKVPTSLTATTNLTSSVRLSWAAVTENTSSVSGDPHSPMIRDLGGYRVYRGATGSFTPATGNKIGDETTVLPLDSPLFLDVTAVNCRPYYYKVTAVDTPCGLESAATAGAAGQATSAVKPQPPANVQAYLLYGNNVRVVWQAVTQDVNGGQIAIDTYKVWRAGPVPVATDPGTLDYSYIGNVVGSLDYIDTHAPSTPADQQIYYRVSAIDDCPNESDLSSSAYPTCSFTGSVQFTTPTEGQPVAGVVTVTATVAGGTDTYTQATFTYTHVSQGVTRTQVVAGAGPSWSDSWLANPPGQYRLDVTVQNSTGCTRSATVHVVYAQSNVGCCLSPPNPTQNPVTMTCSSGAPGCKEVSYQMINNGCLTAVAINSMTVTWVDEVANGAKAAGVKFDGSTIWSVLPNSTSPATNAAFSTPKPQIAVNRNSSNPVNVTYVFDKVASAGVKVKGKWTYYQDTMTTTYGFVLLDSAGAETAVTGTCGPSQGMFQNFIVEQHQ
ncbi:MAG: prepilin-type N-terminal cleavage/methylation domain-containing protein [Acidobacteriia bacterium]|nr:prepilin-type N-terminal cleavage/methylation domain-containing protein [Terriglobia bacterium]